ncbi:hypothetical protein FB567DRAFT_451564 [Paraphoma chrysanthemicola]|uniref:Uncharacterized protein n=1 Tax=Paraphoma chrysanthemicola TaxID=798071 RepID=A0A8K0VU68_9PLEO|nr:hypothetical protein FB567DRAFT_451564 [Paraphoma chrysanthemicola]
MRDSITFRRVTTCAPIKADQYATGWQDNLTEAYTGKGMTSVKFYEFGKGETGCVATPAKQTTNATTFCVSQWMKDSLTGAYLTTANTAYVAMANASDFVPIPDFSMNNADVTLLSIFNQAIYTAKVDDALFNAQNASSKNSQFYTATHDLSVLACMEQYQFCNPRTDKCTNLTGLYATQDAVNNGGLELSGRQQAAFKILWQAGWAMALQWTAKLMNSRVLLAQDWVFTTTATGSGPLQSDQWQRESFNLHNLSLAVFQHRLNQYAAPETFQLSSNLNAADHLDVPTDPDMLDLCKRQRILTSKYYNVSVLGMSIILAVGTLLIIVSQVVEKIWFGYFNPESRLSKQADWTQTGTLQLHRQALEARGIGSWDRKNQDFPVMDAPGTTFIGLGAREERIGQMQEDDKSPYHLVTGEVSTDEKQGFRSP